MMSNPLRSVTAATPMLIEATMCQDRPGTTMPISRVLPLASAVAAKLGTYRCRRITASTCRRVAGSTFGLLFSTSETVDLDRPDSAAMSRIVSFAIRLSSARSVGLVQRLCSGT